MRNKLRVGLILLLMIPSVAFIPACSKKAVTVKKTTEKETHQTEIARQQKIEKERLKKESEERELRAAKIKFMYEDIYFKKGSYALQPEARTILKRKAEFLRNHPDVNIIIEGHTNNRGSKEFNFALGDRRAGEVKSFLIREGIQSLRLIPVSFGNENPVDTRKTEKSRSKNRRVHFVIE